MSICKFKFTGGDSPSLEERKTLSVDAGGNLRYNYSTANSSSSTMLTSASSHLRNGNQVGKKRKNGKIALAMGKKHHFFAVFQCGGAPTAPPPQRVKDPATWRWL